MGLLDILLTGGGSTLSSLEGGPATPYNTAGVLNNASLIGSSLDLNGATPTPYNVIGTLNPAGLLGSTLDLNGETPVKYSDIAPH